MAPAAEGTFGRYALEFIADSKGLKTDLEKLQLQTTKSASQIQQSLATGFNAGVAQARQGMTSMAEWAGTQFGRVAAFITSPIVAIGAIGAALGAFMVSAIREAVEFDRAYNQVRLQLYGTATDVEALKGRLLGLTPSMATAADKAGALGQVLAKGFTPDEAIKLLDIASKLSRVTGVDLNTAAEMLTETLRAYGLGVQDADRVSNILLTTLQKAGGPQGVGNMIFGLGRLIPLAHELHIPLEQVTAALVTMQQQGIEGSRAAMALAMILGKATTETQKFRDANIDIGKIAATEGIPGILRAIRTLTPTLEDLHTMGIEARTLGVMLALAGEGSGRFAENVKAAGAVKLDILVKQTTDLTKSTMDLRTSWEDFKLSVSTLAIPPLSRFMSFVADTIKHLTGREMPKPESMAEWEQRWLKEQQEAAAKAAAAVAIAGAAAGTAGVPGPAGVPMPTAERARMREWLDIRAKGQAEVIKLQEDAEVTSISLDKQVAEARKVTEVELLAFDRQTLKTRLKFEDQRRAARIAAIEEELPLLRETDDAERKQMTALATERQRLIQEGLDAHEQADKQREALDLKTSTAAQKLDDELFEHRKRLELVSLRDEITMLEQRVAAHRGSIQEQQKAEEDLYARKKELREKDRAENQTLTEKAIAALQKEGVTGPITGADIERKIQEMTSRNIQLAQRAQEGRAMTAEEWREALGAPAEVEQYAAAMHREGSLENLRRAGMMIAMPPGTQRTEMGIGGPEWAPVLQTALGGPGAPGGVPGGGIGGGIEAGIGASTDRALTKFKDFTKQMEQEANDSGSRIAKKFYSNMEDWFVRKLIDQAARS